ncbi:ArsR family transcriptional regulator [Methanosarcina sp. 1.H.T.1A.1]|uniref:winged helix-turn-helix transcriptional regulator n=1 Tax=Methanosarcina sp. 1.H.T.1A.1 TaxID=1483602 RepID=UPI000621F66A|nr:ArsR family transcriptional regulator [Methanosarcina sp. 1.H.T.1A.1]KKH95472.1 ArsR family transcriptional regulator [Methanosarcina sp. 1.H.T.1A.1]
MEPKTERLIFTSSKLEKKLILCIFFFLFTTTAGATEYIVSPAPNDEFGVSVAGEDVQILEDTVIPYWQFLLWLAVMNVLSVTDILLLPAKLIFAILGFRVVDYSNTIGVLKRKNIYDFIKTRPGTYIGEIANNMGLNRGTLRHHLQILEAENMIEAQCLGGKVRYFQNSSTYDEKEKRVISALQNEMNRKIISKILKEECNTNGDLALTTGISRCTISWYMKQLKALDLIEENKMGRSKIYSINPVYRDTIEKTYVKFFE